MPSKALSSSDSRAGFRGSPFRNLTKEGRDVPRQVSVWQGTAGPWHSTGCTRLGTNAPGLHAARWVKWQLLPHAKPGGTQPSPAVSPRGQDFRKPPGGAELTPGPRLLLCPRGFSTAETCQPCQERGVREELRASQGALRPPPGWGMWSAPWGEEISGLAPDHQYCPSYGHRGNHPHIPAPFANGGPKGPPEGRNLSLRSQQGRRHCPHKGCHTVQAHVTPGLGRDEAPAATVEGHLGTHCLHPAGAATCCRTPPSTAVWCAPPSTSPTRDLHSLVSVGLRGEAVPHGGHELSHSIVQGEDHGVGAGIKCVRHLEPTRPA